MPTVEQARTWYLEADPVHDFAHVMRVYRTAERLAAQEGADLEIVRAAALLHDAQGSAPGGEGVERASHHHSSAEFAGEVLAAEGWPAARIAAVQHCIRAHRFRDLSEPPATLEAKIIFDADKLDVLGAIGVARVVAYAALDGQPFYAEPSQGFLESGVQAPGEPHSAYHEYLFKLRKIKDRLFTSTARRLAENRDAYLAEFFIRLAAEMRGEI
jgi:uncharacterized protein